MKMYVIGTGTATVSRYVNTSCLFEEDGQYFLVDGTGGIDVLRCFYDMNIRWEDLHHAYLSHEHTDHLLGMVWVVRMITECCELDTYEGTFYMYGHAEVLQKLETICRMLLKAKSASFLGDRIQFVPVEDRETREIWNHSFTFFDIGSKKAKQFGFTMEYENGKKLVFTGDETPDEKSREYIRGADWYLCEAFCLDSQEQIYHAYQYHHHTVKDSAEFAEFYGVKNLLLWHTEEGTFGQRKELYTAEARQYFSGNVYVPDDGEIFEL